LKERNVIYISEDYDSKEESEKKSKNNSSYRKLEAMSGDDGVVGEPVFADHGITVVGPLNCES